MSSESTTRPTLRVAVAHLFATGPYHEGGRHGLVHVGVLPLMAGAQVQDWLINPEKKFPGALGDSMGVKNPIAEAAPTWAEQQIVIQKAFSAFDAILIMDRAGQPSPECEWLKKVVLQGMDKPPVCVALDVLLAFFLPALTLDDADDLLDGLLRRDTTLQAECGYSASKPQLPFVLHTMRRALRQVLDAMLKPAPWRTVAGKVEEWLPVYAILQKCLHQPGVRLPLRPFRLLAQLAQEPTCCDPASDDLLVRSALPALPSPKALPGPDTLRASEVQEVLAGWLKNWRMAWEAAPTGTTVTDRPAEGRLDETAVTTAFAHLAASVDTAAKNAKATSWQQRPAQKEYARFVTQAINTNGLYALEAGTGTGKTFGYLVPALEYLRCHPNGLVVVATSTKNLQQQMLEGELPALLSPKGKPNERYKTVQVAMLKGKNSYLCAEALAEAYDECLAPAASWQQGLAWLYLALRLRDTKGETENAGQAVEVALTPPGSSRSALHTWRARVAADQACRHADNGPDHPFAVCVYGAHRQRAEQAHLLVLNHHKLAVLPRTLLERQGRICIIDEADRFPDNFRSAIASELNARELVQEVLYKLLGRPRDPVPRHNAEPTATEVPEHVDEIGLIGRAQERLRTVHQRLWFEAGFGTLGSADNAADIAALEAWDEARLHDLLGNFALHQQVAEIMADTPAALTTQATADAALAAYEVVRAAQAPRRAAQRALLALQHQRSPTQQCLDLLPAIGQEFVAAGPRQPARLPFPTGRESHWLDQVPIAQPSGPIHYRSLYWNLHHALRPLEAPLTAAANYLAILRDAVPVALQLHTAPEDTEENTKAQKADLRLRRQLEQAAGQLSDAAYTLAGLLAEGRGARYVPIVERLQGEEHSPLGWRLGRAPYDLQPYLQGPVPPRTGQSDVAKKAFFDQFSVTIFTSATLYVEKSTAYFRQQLNLTEQFKAELCLPSAFDYFKPGAEYVAGLLPHYLPHFVSGASEPGKKQWRNDQLKALLPLLVAFGGRTLVLFTSREEMDYVAAKLQPHLAQHDIELLVQQGTSQWQIRRFRRIENSVLLGVERMWTGVDFAGPTLAQVVVWRLPMPSFSDPLVCHRKLHEPKSSFWENFYYPTTRLKLRQGFGRLVRRAGDQGSFVMLDSRANQEFYHHLLSEISILPFTGLAAADEFHQHIVDEVLTLIPGLKTDFTDYRKLTAKKLGAIVPDSF